MSFFSMAELSDDLGSVQVQFSLIKADGKNECRRTVDCCSVDCQCVLLPPESGKIHKCII